MEKASKNFIKSLKKQKRENKSLLFLDNVKIIRDALQKKAIQPLCILSCLPEEEFLALHLVENKAKTYSTSDNLEEVLAELSSQEETLVLSCSQADIDALADTKTPQKVLCIAYHTQYMVEKPKTNFLVLDGLQDPGNVGTLIRTAKASGFEYVFLLDSVKKSNDKLIRSSAGAVLDSKVYEMSRAEFEHFAKENRLKLICCDMSGQSIFNFQCKGIVGVVVGNEGQGVSQVLRSICHKTIKIPMKEGIESLNAGVSGSIIMYEINKNQF